MKEQLQKLAKIGGGVLLSYALLRGCDEANKVYQAKQAELDQLCGKDRSGCIVTTNTECYPDFAGGVACVPHSTLSTMTPARK